MTMATRPERTSGAPKWDFTSASSSQTDPAADEQSPDEVPSQQAEAASTVGDRTTGANISIVDQAASAADSTAEDGGQPAIDERPATSSKPRRPRRETASKSTPRPAAATTSQSEGTPAAEPAAGVARVPEASYQQDPAEPRHKDWGAIPSSLAQTIEMTRMQWAVTNTAWFTEHGGPPHVYGFKEALIRLGLKHINDPEFAALLPPDKRRTRGGQQDSPES